MKKAIVIFLTALALYSCAKRIAPTTNAANTASDVKADKITAPAPPPVAESQPTATAITNEAVALSEPVVKTETKQITAGKETFKAKCGRCHDLKEPETYNAEKWVKIIDWMAPKAKLDASEKENVLAYVSFYAKA